MRSTTRALGVFALLCTGVLQSSGCEPSPRTIADHPELPAPSSPDGTSTDDALSWVLDARLSSCGWMPWFVSVVRDFDEDGRDDLLLGCSNELTVSFGAASTLEPGVQLDGLDRLVYSAASLTRGDHQAYLLGGDRTTSVIVVEAERGEGGWDTKTSLVEVDAWRDDAGEARPGRVLVLDDGGTLREGIAYAAGPGAIVELEWRREADQAGAVHVLRSWPVPELGEFDRLALVDLRGDGAPSLVLLAHPKPRTNHCRLAVLEWPTRRDAGRLDLGEAREYLVPRACESVPVVGDEIGLALHLEGDSVALLRLDDDGVDAQIELPARRHDTLALHDTTPLVVFGQRSQLDSSRLCLEVVARHLSAEPGGEAVSSSAVSKFLVEDGAVTEVRSLPLPEGLSLGAVAYGDFDGDGRPEALFVDQYDPQHVVSRALRRGCD
ncbi:hypothetical protein G6O69_15855 [Pseudenhygromyxa sp. WMMC2535]|uniref:hypothetical protein n=1 Tax=Pseudenhygromyxa sp. WMMC2535 TaxID=2712867 RepID=UPI0015571DBB|nr:hypothetical protein [Pseudenhygromyxa sp. WMMC2535]NVB39318.1 hypothetical protein [Pseudenhygromyxa sp. WMMC2535]